MPKHHHHHLPLLERLSIKVTDWMGTTQSVLVHTFLFTACFAMILAGVSVDKVMLVVTTAVSLEAIYLALFIQMTVNRHSRSLKEVEEDIDEIQEDVEDIGEIKEDVADISEDIEDLQDADSEEDRLDQQHEVKTLQSLETIEQQMTILTQNFATIKSEINSLKSTYTPHNNP